LAYRFLVFCRDFIARNVLKIKWWRSSSHFGGNLGNWCGCGVKCGLKTSLYAQTSESGLVSIGFGALEIQALTISSVSFAAGSGADFQITSQPCSVLALLRSS
jgi:hypothetical protein